MIGQLHICECAFEQGGLLHCAPSTSVGKAFAACVGFSQFTLVSPATAFHQVVDVGAISTFCVAVDTKGSNLKRAAVLLLVSQRMLANPVHLKRLICRCSQKSRFCQQLDLQRHQVTKDARQGDHNIYAGSTQLRQGNQGRTSKAAVTVKAGQCSHQCQSLGNRSTFVFEVIATPQNHGDGFRQCIAISHVTIKQQLGLLGTVFDSKTAGYAERIKTVHVAPGWQHRRRAQNVAARCWANVATIQSAQHGAYFCVDSQHGVGITQLCQYGLECIVTAHSTRFQCLLNRVARYQRLNSGAGQLLPVRCIGHGQQHVNALHSARRTTGYMQTVWNQRVLQLQHLFSEPCHTTVRITFWLCIPQRGRICQIKLSRLGLQQGSKLTAVSGLWLHGAPAFNGCFEVVQPFVQTSLCDRRRQVTDQRRA